MSKVNVEYLVGFPLDPDLLDPERPLESIALGMLANPINPPYGTGVEEIVKMTEQYKIDGVVSVVKRTCGLLPGMQKLIKEALLERIGVPSIVFDLDGVDEREHDDGAIRANLDAFVQTLLSRKEG